MTIGVLTSSRADYGIYKPLLGMLRDDPFFDLRIIVFGTHLSALHGLTIKEILADGFEISYSIESTPEGDSPHDIAAATALTSLKFADFWKDNADEFDLVFCLGDRYEMFSAVYAAVPYNMKFAHIHGGEKTLGSIDNIYRHAITLASSLHFVSTQAYRERVACLKESDEDVYLVGALSIDNLNQMKLLSIGEFKSKYKIDFNIPTILCTFHPETTATGRNLQYSRVITDVMREKSGEFQFVITLPNADTENLAIRSVFTELEMELSGRVFCIESLGNRDYFSCMKHCYCLLGNTSSGIIEAASMKKYVINLGERQRGRIKGNNVIDVEIEKNAVLRAIEELDTSHSDTIKNPYFAGGAKDKIIEVLKRIGTTG